MAKLTERQIAIIVKIQTLLAAANIDAMNKNDIPSVVSCVMVASMCNSQCVHIANAIRAGAEFEDLLCIALEIKS